MKVLLLFISFFFSLSVNAQYAIPQKKCCKGDTVKCVEKISVVEKLYQAEWDGSQIIEIENIDNAEITQTSLGNYSIVFSNPLPDNNYQVKVTIENTGGDDILDYVSSITASGFNLLIAEQDNGGAAGAPRNNSFILNIERCVEICKEYESIEGIVETECEDCKDYIESLIPENLDNDPSNEIQTLTANGNSSTGTTSITISGGNTINIEHPPVDINEIYCSGDFETGTGRTGWWQGWTAVTQNSNVPRTLLNWVNISNSRISPNCLTDMTVNVNLGNHLLFIRRIRAYVWIDYRLLINGIPVWTKNFHSYLYEDERNDTNPNVIPPQQYQTRIGGSGHGFRLNVPASSTVQVQARVRYQAVGFQPSSYFRYIGGLRSEANFSFNPTTELTDISIQSNEDKYWILSEEQGYTHGIGIGDQIPENAVFFESENEYLEAIDKAEELALKQRETFNNEALKMIEELNNISESLFLEDIKEAYTVKELKAKAKENGLRGYSRLKEDELIKFLIDNGVSL